MDDFYKPEGYNSLSPYLVVKDAAALSAMLKEIFNAREKRKYLREDGSILHMELLIEDTILMMADATEQYPAQPVMLHLYLPDVDKSYKKALDTGCKGIAPPSVKNGDRDKRGLFEDISGNIWAVSTQQ